MKWSLKLVLRRLLLNKKRNILLVIQIFLGAAVLFSCLSIEESCRRKSAEYSEGISSRAITINANRSPEDEDLNTDDYEYIRDNLLPENYTAVFTFSTGMYIEYNGREWRVPVVFASEGYMTAMAGVKNPDPEGYYLGEKLTEAFYSNECRVTYGEGIYDRAAGELFGRPVRDYTVPEVSSTAQTAGDSYQNSFLDEDLTFANSIILPLALHDRYKDSLVGISGLYIIPEQENDPSVDEVCGRICSELSERYPSGWFTYSNDLADLLKFQTELLLNASLFKTVSAVMIIILFFELIGQFMLTAFRRQRSFAIARMCGAAAGKLVLELFLEIGLPASLGALAGIGAAALAVPSFSSSLYSVQGTGGAAGVVYGLFLGIAAVTVLFCVPTIVRSTPANILRNHDE